MKPFRYGRSCSSSKDGSRYSSTTVSSSICISLIASGCCMQALIRSWRMMYVVMELARYSSKRRHCNASGDNFEASWRCMICSAQFHPLRSSSDLFMILFISWLICFPFAFHGARGSGRWLKKGKISSKESESAFASTKERRNRSSSCFSFASGWTMRFPSSRRYVVLDGYRSKCALKPSGWKTSSCNTCLLSRSWTQAYDSLALVFNTACLDDVGSSDRKMPFEHAFVEECHPWTWPVNSASPFV